MTLFPLLLFLSAVLPPSILQEHYNTMHVKFADLSTTSVSVQEEIVNKHNQLRRMVSPPGSDLLKMQWSNGLLLYAHTWARDCRHLPNAERRNNFLCRENFFMTRYPTSWSRVIQSWYDEAKDFTFGSGPKSPNAVVGNYTQVVWNSTYLVQCEVAQCYGMMQFIYVCQYCSHRNIGERQYIPYTVGEPCALCPDHCDNGLCINNCEYRDDLSHCEELKRNLTCDFIVVKLGCEATCQCEGKIH